jgi:hypothetical protein
MEEQMKNVFLAMMFLMLMSSLHAHAQQLPEAPAPHRFLDKSNILLLASTATTISLDGLSSQYCQRWGSREMNPIARPFIYNRIGDAAYMSVSYGLLVSGMYMAHRRGWHRVERLVPLLVNGSETYWTVHNFGIHQRVIPVTPITTLPAQVPVYTAR